jgi:predicted component of viral defense system (DUF524 family)
MAAEPQKIGIVECRAPNGSVIATVEIFAPAGSDHLKGEDHPLVLLAEEEARRNGEERLQLRERERYEYRLKRAAGVADELSLLSHRGVQPSRVNSDGEDRGLIEPGDQCGLFTLTVVRKSDATEQPLARGSVEVRSFKLGYREHYRGMLTSIAEKCAGLLLDSRAPTRLRLDTLWKIDSRILEQQLEFLRHTLESSAFRGAIDEVLHNPHRRLEEEREVRDISRPFKPGKDFARQIAVATRRVAVPATHPLHSTIASLPARISVQLRSDFLDTAENRFAKMVLVEFRDFLVDISAHIARSRTMARQPESARLHREVGRLRGMLETQLSRGFFPDVSMPTLLPLGSPVLQRKSGYRELLRFWLQFHAGAQLAWEGGSEVFHAGARNVATLYEYWLFFQLEALFRQKFACDTPLHAIVLNKSKAPPQLVLKRGVQLGTPVTGVWSEASGRNLKAEFQFNRKFAPNADRTKSGSWTRGVQPDYTISIWPAEYSKEEAEQNELMVHVHFDAKYRVERVAELLGDEADDAGFDKEAAPEARSMAKYDDLLKMHAYRDAVRRTAGAYILYPGNPADGNSQYKGFHEVLPGLGAFAVRPDTDGKATGIEAVSVFLDTVIVHLANRTTARERVTYHLSESYGDHSEPIDQGMASLPEADLFGDNHRALPPAEEMVLVAWYENDAQLDLARDKAGFAYVRLGRRQGALHVHPNLARVRRILLRTEGGSVATGFLTLREPGFRVFTRAQLRSELQQHAKGKGVAAWEGSIGTDDDETIYALFKTEADPDWAAQQWNGDLLMKRIEQFESDARNKLVENVGRTSPYPRILSLKDVLIARG